jgi:uncharacterized membrane protein YhaH (DUF805 family)
MTFFEAIKSVISQFNNFHGRARRSEFWWYNLFECVVCFGLSIIGNVTGIQAFIIGIYVFQLLLLLPGLAVCFRRMHDTGKSAWWLLPALIPVAGQIYMMLRFIKDSQPGENKYGPNPKGL